MKKNIILIVFLSFLLAGCIEENPTETNKLGDIAEENAEAVAKRAQAAPHEIEGITKRRFLMSTIGLNMYAVFIDMGRPIKYIVTEGKCVSSKKKLKRPEAYERIYSETHKAQYTWAIVPGRSEDGTFGSSGEYRYCFDTNGVYHEWNGLMYISDQPVTLTLEPIMVSVIPTPEEIIENRVKLAKQVLVEAVADLTKAEGYLQVVLESDADKNKESRVKQARAEVARLREQVDFVQQRYDAVIEESGLNKE